MIVVDVETTGLDSKRNSIVSIGALEFQDPENQFYQECIIWPGAEIEQGALDINGFREEHIKKNKPTLEQTMKGFVEWTKNIPAKIIAGQNPGFDRGFLENSAERYDIEWSIGRRTIDLHTLCYAHMMRRRMERKINSDEIMEYVGIPAEPKPHIALNGALWEAEAFSRIIHKNNLLSMFSEYPIPSYLKE